jgi:hypothetical protein
LRRQPAAPATPAAAPGQGPAITRTLETAIQAANLPAPHPAPFLSSCPAIPQSTRPTNRLHTHLLLCPHPPIPPPHTHTHPVKTNPEYCACLCGPGYACFLPCVPTRTQVSELVRLRVLDLEGCEGLTSGCLPALAPLTRLTALNLGQCPGLKGHKLHHIAGGTHADRLFGVCS